MPDAFDPTKEPVLFFRVWFSLYLPSTLPVKLDELVPLSFIGQTAVNFYRDKIKLMDQLKMTEAQRKATLSDGQDAGEMLLDIEGRIGEIAIATPRGRTAKKGKQGGASVDPPKHERLNLPSQKKMQQSQQIAKHPEIVEKVKAQAKENEDIPTKTAVLSEIKYQKEKQRKATALILRVGLGRLR